jgi:hypothetical protein
MKPFLGGTSIFPEAIEDLQTLLDASSDRLVVGRKDVPMLTMIRGYLRRSDARNTRNMAVRCAGGVGGVP